MLAGAIVIIVQAPRCKPLPDMNWWNMGPLYQIGDVNAFAGPSGLKGKDMYEIKTGRFKCHGISPCFVQLQ